MTGLRKFIMFQPNISMFITPLRPLPKRGSQRRTFTPQAGIRFGSRCPREKEKLARRKVVVLHPCSTRTQDSSHKAQRQITTTLTVISQTPGSCRAPTRPRVHAPLGAARWAPGGQGNHGAVLLCSQEAAFPGGWGQFCNPVLTTAVLIPACNKTAVRSLRTSP